MRGDRIQHLLWWIKFGLLPVNVDIVIIHAGTNNLSKNKHVEVCRRHPSESEGCLLQTSTYRLCKKQRLPNQRLYFWIIAKRSENSRFEMIYIL